MPWRCCTLDLWTKGLTPWNGRHLLVPGRSSSESWSNASRVSLSTPVVRGAEPHHPTMGWEPVQGGARWHWIFFSCCFSIVHLIVLCSLKQSKAKPSQLVNTMATNPDHSGELSDFHPSWARGPTLACEQMNELNDWVDEQNECEAIVSSAKEYKPCFLFPFSSLSLPSLPAHFLPGLGGRCHEFCRQGVFPLGLENGSIRCRKLDRHLQDYARDLTLKGSWVMKYEQLYIGLLKALASLQQTCKLWKNIEDWSLRGRCSPLSDRSLRAQLEADRRGSLIHQLNVRQGLSVSTEDSCPGPERLEY